MTVFWLLSVFIALQSSVFF